MRFTLKSLLLTLTILAVMMAIAAPLVRLLSTGQQLRLLMGITACLTGLAISEVFLRWRKSAMSRKIGGQSLVELAIKQQTAESSRFLWFLQKASFPFDCVFAIALIAVYVGLASFRSGPGEMTGWLFLVLIVQNAATLPGVWRMSVNGSRQVYRFGEHGIALNDWVLTPWRRIEEVRYREANQTLTLVTTALLRIRLDCSEADAQRVKDLRPMPRRSPFDT